MKWLYLLLLLPGLAFAQQNYVDCAANTPCTLTGPSGTGTGDPAWLAFGKINTNETQLFSQVFGAIPGNTVMGNGTTTASQPTPINFGVVMGAGNFYPAINYGGTWDSTHDVGVAINAAISAASSAGGGTVVLPCGKFGLSTPVVVSTNGVHVQGCGVGSPQDSNTRITFLGWIGGSSPGVTAWKVSGVDTLFSVDQKGFYVGCESKPNGSSTQGCDYAVVLDGVSYSDMDIGGGESTIANIWLTTHSGQTSHGTQRNYFKLWSNSTSSVYAPVGILVDGRTGSGLNVSINTFLNIDCQFNLGDCVVFGNSDNNLVLYRYAWAFGGFPGTATGNAFVVANSAYTTANGTINNRGRLVRILRNGGKGVTWVQGTRQGATVTANGGNAGTANLQTFNLTTNSTLSLSLTKLKFASTTDGTTGLSVDTGMSVSCGGSGNGVGNNSVIQKVVGGGTPGVILVEPQAATTSGNIACTFAWNTTPTTQNGTYTLSYCTSAVPAHCGNYTGNGYYLDAGATGGTTQGPVSLTSPGSGTNGVLVFTDMELVWTGSPTTGDFWTIVIPNPSFSTDFEGVDDGNHTASPSWEYGATGYSQYLNQSCPIGFPAGNEFSGVLTDNLTVGTGTCTVNFAGNSFVLAAPAISAGFNTSGRSVVGSNTLAFQIVVGTGTGTSTGALTMPTATNGWSCSVADVTTPATNLVQQTGSTVSTVTVTNYVRTTGVAGNFTNSDKLNFMCGAF